MAGTYSGSAFGRVADSRDRLGMHVNVVARVRPVARGQPNTLKNIDSSKRTKVSLYGDTAGDGAQYDVDAVYGPQSTNSDLYAHSFNAKLDQLVAGVNVGVVSFGQSQSGKTHTIDGGPADRSGGLASLMVEGLFDLLKQRQRQTVTENGRVSLVYRVTMQYMEIYNERITDLLDLHAPDMPLHPLQAGAVVKELRTENVDNAVEFHNLLQKGKAAKNASVTEFGPASHRAHSILVVQLTQFFEGLDMDSTHTRTTSQLVFVDTAGSEKLRDDPEALHAREGRMLNHSTLSLGNLIRALSVPSSAAFANYRQSTLTALLSDVLGGNCLTTVVACLRSDNILESHSAMNYAAQLRRIHNYPIINDYNAEELINKYSMTIAQMRDTIAALREGQGMPSDDITLSNQLLELNDLQGQLHEKEVQILQTREEKEKLFDKLVLLRDKYNALVDSKADLQGQLIESEEERLKVSKALIDLRIQLESMNEDSQSNNFDLANKLMTAENMFAAMKATKEEQDAQIERMRKDVGETATTNKQLSEDLAHLKGKHEAVSKELDVERAKVEQLGLELVNLANAKRELVSERDTLMEERGRLQRLSSNLAEGVPGMAEQHKQQLEGSVKRKEIELDRMNLKLEERKFEMEKHMMNEMRGKEHAMFQNRADLEHQLKLAEEKKNSLHEGLAVMEKDFKRVNQRVVELESEITSLQAAEREYKGERDATTMRFAQQEEAFRQKIQQYMQELTKLKNMVDHGNPSSTAYLQVAADTMLQDLIDSYTNKERQLLQDVEMLRRKNGDLVAKNKMFLDQYRTLRFHAEDMQRRGGTGEDALKKPIVHEDDLKAFVVDHTELTRDLESEARHQRQLARELEEKLSQAKEDLLKATEEHQKTIIDFQPLEKDGAPIPASLKAKEAEIVRLRRRLATIERDRTDGLNLLRRQMREFTLTTQQSLERERAKLLARATVAERQLTEIQDYMDSSVPRYQKEIMRLRTEIGDLDDQLVQAKREVRRSRLASSRSSRGKAAGDADADASPPFRVPSVRHTRSADNNRGQRSTPANPNNVDAWGRQPSPPKQPASSYRGRTPPRQQAAPVPSEFGPGQYQQPLGMQYQIPGQQIPPQQQYVAPQQPVMQPQQPVMQPQQPVQQPQQPVQQSQSAMQPQQPLMQQQQPVMQQQQQPVMQQPMIQQQMQQQPMIQQQMQQQPMIQQQMQQQPMIQQQMQQQPMIQQQMQQQPMMQQQVQPHIQQPQYQPVETPKHSIAVDTPSPHASFDREVIRDANGALASPPVPGKGAYNIDEAIRTDPTRRLSPASRASRDSAASRDTKVQHTQLFA